MKLFTTPKKKKNSQDIEPEKTIETKSVDDKLEESNSSSESQMDQVNEKEPEKPQSTIGRISALFLKNSRAAKKENQNQIEKAKLEEESQKLVNQDSTLEDKQRSFVEESVSTENINNQTTKVEENTETSVDEFGPETEEKGFEFFVDKTTVEADQEENESSSPMYIDLKNENKDTLVLETPPLESEGTDEEEKKELKSNDLAFEETINPVLNLEETEVQDILDEIIEEETNQDQTTEIKSEEDSQELIFSDNPDEIIEDEGITSKETERNVLSFSAFTASSEGGTELETDSNKDEAFLEENLIFEESANGEVIEQEEIIPVLAEETENDTFIIENTKEDRDYINDSFIDDIEVVYFGDPEEDEEVLEESSYSAQELDSQALTSDLANQENSDVEVPTLKESLAAENSEFTDINSEIIPEFADVEQEKAVLGQEDILEETVSDYSTQEPLIKNGKEIEERLISVQSSVPRLSSLEEINDPDYEYATRDIPQLRDIVPLNSDTALMLVVGSEEEKENLVQIEKQEEQLEYTSPIEQENPQVKATESVEENRFTETRQEELSVEEPPEQHRSVHPESESYYSLMNELMEGRYQPEDTYEINTIESPEQARQEIVSSTEVEEESYEGPDLNLHISRIREDREDLSEEFKRRNLDEKLKQEAPVSSAEPPSPHSHRPSKVPMFGQVKTEPKVQTQTIDISVTSVQEMNDERQSEYLGVTPTERYYDSNAATQKIASSFESMSQSEEVTSKRTKETKRQLRRQEQHNRERMRSQTQEMTQNLKSVQQSEKNLIYSKVPDNVLRGGITLFNNLAKQMQSNNALRVESLMSVLGAVAGYATQEAAREKMVNRLYLDESQVFSVVETKNGEKYYFGDTIDRMLQKDEHSIWYMTASATMKLTGKVESNIDEIIKHSTRSLGSETFGVPRLPKNYRPSHLPKYYVEHMWAALRPGLDRFSDDPLEWPQIFSVALQRALICTRTILDPNISLKIILESAVPMSMAEIHPIEPNSLRSEEEAKKRMVSRLRKDIEMLRKTLTNQKIPQDQRALLLDELSRKTEMLIDLVSNTSNVN